MNDIVKIPETLIPLSYLALDLEPPANGWADALAALGIETTLDDLGRLSVRRSDARKLFEQKRQAEQRAREIAEARERAAIERDAEFRAALPRGLSWLDVPPGMSPVEYMTASDRENQPRTRPSDAEWLFAKPGEITGGTFGPGSEWQ
jgi:hypothetical protein